MWGFGLLAEVGIRLVVISSQSVDVANGINSVISLAMIGLLMVATFLVSRRAGRPGTKERLRGLSAAGSTLEDRWLK